MAQAINMPKMGNTVESVIVGEIFISVGDQIKKDQKLFSYETDKSTTDYKSEIEGEVLAILMESGEEVDVLVPVIIVGKKGDDISQWTSKSKEEPSTDQPEPPKAETKEPVKERTCSSRGKNNSCSRITKANGWQDFLTSKISC